MTKNWLCYLSLYRGMVTSSVTIARASSRKVYLQPTYASLKRLCACVTTRGARQTMGVYLWPEGFWAHVLIEKM